MGQTVLVPVDATFIVSVCKLQGRWSSPDSLRKATVKFVGVQTLVITKIIESKKDDRDRHDLLLTI